jgi:hypothetical protein
MSFVEPAVLGLLKMTLKFPRLLSTLHLINICHIFKFAKCIVIFAVFFINRVYDLVFQPRAKSLRHWKKTDISRPDNKLLNYASEDSEDDINGRLIHESTEGATPGVPVVSIFSPRDVLVFYGTATRESSNTGRTIDITTKSARA